MKSKIIYGILAIVFAFSLSACGSGTKSSNNLIPATNTFVPPISNVKSSSTPNLETVNKAYDAILKEYGIKPHSSDDMNSTDYSIEDIIGDSTPELIIYGDSFEIRDDNYRNAKDIYGYDNNKGETFQYKGETQIVEPHKGKDNYCIGGTHSEGSLLYSIYEASGKLIKLVQKINHDISNPDSSGSMYTIGDKTVSKEDFKNELSKYVDISSLPEYMKGFLNTDDKTPQFSRTDYFTGTSRKDLLRYTDKYMSSKVFFEQYKITQVVEPKLYYAKSVSLGSSADDYIVIDDRNDNNGDANTVVGEQVSVYGVFSGTRTTTITYSNNSQASVLIPEISADLLVINSILPKPEDFASVMIDSLNAQLRYDSQSQSQYISGSTIKLACMISDIGSIRTHLKVIEKGDDRLRVDGYSLYLFWDYKGNEYDHLSESNDLFKDFAITKPNNTVDNKYTPIWVTGNITSIKNNMFDPALLHAVIDIKKIEIREVSTGG
ncbi:MAG: hypothetical protein ACYDG2_16155 [Ruminiclostridium sp.]